ncbi:hypothetical protein ABH926_006300 [Catenulispora sp. GP43]|uniref:hypothetical protein n=1 Tax=Catenulispora sp. GP43 TaxID=3156263 RepID=UPI003511A952
MRARVIALIAAVGFAAAGCASSTTGTASQPSAPASPSPTSTQSAAPTTTITKIVTPSTATTTTSAAPGVTPAAQDPASVVSAFYAAINAQDYATAWKLGGDNLGSSYSAFAAGFAGTAHDSLTITGVQGGTVDVHLEALQIDGSTKVYDGFYLVSNGQITEGRLTQTATIPAA